MLQEKKYIAIFDSGIGGFTALLNAVALLPHESFLFYGDTLNVPYGEKPADTVRELTLRAVAEIVPCGVKAVVLACNTATSAAAAQLRQTYAFPILGMEPAVKPALAATRHNATASRVLLLSTLLTMQGRKLEDNLRLVDPDNRVDCRPFSELVTLAEAMEFAGPRVEEYLRANILNIDLERYGAVVLGCTHFIWYKDLFRKLLPAHIKLFDGNDGTLRHLRNVLDKGGQLAGPQSGREILIRFTGDISETKLKALVSKIKAPVRVI